MCSKLEWLKGEHVRPVLVLNTTDVKDGCNRNRTFGCVQMNYVNTDVHLLNLKHATKT